MTARGQQEASKRPARGQEEASKRPGEEISKSRGTQLLLKVLYILVFQVHILNLHWCVEHRASSEALTRPSSAAGRQGAAP